MERPAGCLSHMTLRRNPSGIRTSPSDLDVHNAQFGHVAHEGFSDGNVIGMTEIGGECVAIG